MQATLRSLEGRIDVERHEQSARLPRHPGPLVARCLLYLRTFSGRSIPEGYEP